MALTKRCSPKSLLDNLLATPRRTSLAQSSGGDLGVSYDFAQSDATNPFDTPDEGGLSP